MVDRVGVVVNGQLVGTIPAFPNGIGDMFKSQFFMENRAEVWAEVRDGDVVLVKAANLGVARAIPKFQST